MNIDYRKFSDVRQIMRNNQPCPNIKLQCFTTLRLVDFCQEKQNEDYVRKKEEGQYSTLGNKMTTPKNLTKKS